MGMKTDPLDPLAWWRVDPFPLDEQRIVALEEDADDDLPLRQRRPRARVEFNEEIDDVLVEIAARNRRATGERRIRWGPTIYQLRRRLPNLRFTDTQIKSRYKTLVKRGLVNRN